MKLKFSNFGELSLATELDASDTTMTIDDYSKLPTLGADERYRLTLFDGVNVPEIVEVTSRTDYVLTITRAQEGTSAIAWDAGTRIRLSPTAEALESLFSRLEVSWCGLATGTANAIELVSDQTINAYADGQIFVFVSDEANTGTTTIAIDGLDAIDLKKLDGTTDVVSGEIPASSVIMVCISGGVAVLMQPIASSSVLSGTTLEVSGTGIIQTLSVPNELSAGTPADDDNSSRVPTTSWVIARITELTAPSDTSFTDSLDIPNAKNYGAKDIGGTVRALIQMTASDLVRIGNDTSTTIEFETSGGALCTIPSTGIPAHPTPSAGDDSTKSATTEFVADAISSALGGGYAPLASPTFTGTPAAPTAGAGTDTTQLATTEFVNSTALTLSAGTTAVTQAASDDSTKVATTAYVQSQPTPTPDKLSTASGSAPSYSLRAWFQGTIDSAASTTVDIQAQGNITSVGSVSGSVNRSATVTFTTAMPDADYIVNAVGHWNESGYYVLCNVTSKSTTGFTLEWTTLSSSSNQCISKAPSGSEVQSLDIQILR